MTPIRRAVSLLFVLVLGLSACEKPMVEHKETLYIFGTLVEFTIRGIDAETARKAVAAVDADFQRMHRDWHAWKPGELTELNAAFAEGRTQEVTPFLLPLVEQAKSLYRQSDGLFNPAIGGLIGIWGFHDDEPPKGELPDFAAIAALVKANPTMDDVIVTGNIVRSVNPSVQLDFGGFGKGVALDRAMRRLREFGIDNAIINAGGDLNTMGSAGDRPWKVGIRHPRNWGVIASVTMGPDENLYTSGNYERFREHEGIRYAHIIDPRDGMPVRHIVSASVIHKDGAVADAAATAMSVAGPGSWHRIARAMGIKFALLVDEDGTVYANPAMADRVAFEPGEPKRLVLSDPL
ncbi:MAG: FAD:protein FMN transferase [Rhodospirillales bacterium]|nr:FAD:protein FMN transferase [Rhodospirillales bacterium]MCW8860988.1 FAD:protein FMN transferase [Rhodospirillales bacterium]MCW8952015.1 FAD:protein FMN transferase [Rhodospirillales bacterium]MCW8971445.1 FAD:protein FMN transferase [Rhodospirillales bacterium]MCW9001621.1 FAD:protein FMN transferase [Rhodospirillales bacterium]